MSSKVIAIDFDGTLADHRYPDIGAEVPEAIATCLALQERGHRLILYTMRHGSELSAAVEWCRDRGVKFWAVNDNPDWNSGSRKVHAHYVIDDRAACCPLRDSPRLVGEPTVDWRRVRVWLERKGLL